MQVPENLGDIRVTLIYCEFNVQVTTLLGKLDEAATSSSQSSSQEDVAQLTAKASMK